MKTSTSALARCVAGMGLSLGLAAAGAGELPKVDLARAAEISAARCGLCHGVDGDSSSPLYPRLASQHHQYIAKQLADFKAGRQDVAEFWIELHGRFVHIRYFAVRDEARRYLGTLEVTQDLTRLRALTGERRLLSYDPPAQESQP